MNRFNLVVLFIFVSGCNGEEFTTFSRSELDAADSASGGSLGVTGGAPGTATGGAPETDAGAGGASQATGGSSHSTGGSFQETGGSSQAGGSPSTGGVLTTGGALAVDACALVTHDNGLGQTWQDCVPLGTYNQEQAMKACEASDAAMCIKSERCGSGVYEVQGFNADRSHLIGEWGYGSFATGYVSPNYNLCSPNDPARRTWG